MNVKSILLLFSLLTLPFATSANEEAAPQKEYSISYQQLQEAISSELMSSGAGDKVEALLSNVNERIFASSSKPLSLRVEFIDYDDRNQRWEAEVAVHDEKGVLKTQTLSGRYNAMQKVPVLNRRIFAGDVITQDDIGSTLMASNRLRHNTIQDASGLIGMAARRSIRKGSPVSAHEIEAPRIVKKGDLLSLRYNTPNITIQTIAEAMEDAALGSSIAMRNTDSGHILHATIVAAGVAEIRQHILLSRNEQN